MKLNETQFSGVIEYVETLRTGSFTAAGERLGLTGSAVGKSVTRLEKKLGTKLLHRTTRSLTPTPKASVILMAGLRFSMKLTAWNMAWWPGAFTFRAT